MQREHCPCTQHPECKRDNRIHLMCSHDLSVSPMSGRLAPPEGLGTDLPHRPSTVPFHAVQCHDNQAATPNGIATSKATTTTPHIPQVA